MTDPEEVIKQLKSGDIKTANLNNVPIGNPNKTFFLLNLPNCKRDLNLVPGFILINFGVGHTDMLVFI